MAGRIRQLYEFRNIEGVTGLDPSTAQDGLFTKWNNTTKVFDYSKVGDGGDSDINTTYFTSFVQDLLPSTSSDDYLNAVTRVNNTARFTYNISSSTVDLELGELAWLDSVEADLTLPGDTKVLLDVSDELSGSENLTYNYTSDRLQLKASVVFDTSEGTYKEGIRYLGNYSFSFGNGVIGTNTGGEYNITGGYKSGNTLSTGSSRNVMLGPNTGESAATNIAGSIFLGSYAGRYETGNNKFFLDNQDHTDTATARSSSFLYADLSIERRLYIRDRLSVEKEGKFGYSGLNDASGEYGMYQMSAASGGSPQWHDGSVWQDFANTTDTYLDSTSFDGTNITFTLSDATVLPVLDISSVNTITFATSPSSPATGKVTSDYGYLQISNSSFTDNEGFTYVQDLLWDNNSKELYIPGGINLIDSDGTSYSDNTLWSNGEHVYAKLSGGTTVQLDNVVGTGEANTASNVGTGIEFWADKDGYDLRFYSLNTGDSRVQLIQATDPTTDPENNINLLLTPTENFIGTTSTPTSGPVYALKDVTGSTSQNPTWNYRPIICTDGSVTLNTNANDEIVISATGTGNPNIYTWNDSTGTGAVLADAVSSTSTDFFVKRLEGVTGKHITVANDTGGKKVNFSVDDITLTDLGIGIYNLVQDGSDSFVYTQKAFTEGYAISLDNTTDPSLIEIGVTASIPLTQFNSRSITYSGGLISWQVQHTDDFINVAPETTNIVELNVGDGLSYDWATNTLSANNSGSSSDDYALRQVVMWSDSDTERTYRLYVKDALGTTTENTYDLVFPKFTTLADYTDAAGTTGSGGSIKVLDKEVTWTISTQRHLTLDEATGKLSIEQELVTYDTQNELFDEDNDGWTGNPISPGPLNTKRAQARANIGAAYIQGSGFIDFYMNDAIIGGNIFAVGSTDTHKIGNLEISDQSIAAATTSPITIQAADGAGLSGAKVEVSGANVTITLGNQPTAPNLYVKDHSGTNIMVLDESGNLFIKGNIYADGEIEAFSDDTTV